MKSMLDIKNLHAGYGASAVLFGATLQLQAGQVLSLLGRNGMGKSTLIRCILGLLHPTQGEIRFDDKAIAGWRPDKIARAGVAIVPEGRQCFPNLTVHEHLSAFLAHRNADSSGQWDADRVYAMFPRLAERKKNMGNQLSGGEQQMLAIGRALMTRPRLLLLDEPTLGLAPLIINQIFEIIQTIRAEGVTVFLVEQNANKALHIADRAYVLETGKVVMEDSGANLLSNDAVRKAYLGA